MRSNPATQTASVPTVSGLKRHHCSPGDVVTDNRSFALLHCQDTRTREGAVHASDELLATAYVSLIRFDKDVADTHPVIVPLVLQFLLDRSKRTGSVSYTHLTLPTSDLV